MNPLPIDADEKVRRHIDALFGPGVSDALPSKDIQFEFSRRTGRIKNFSIGGRLIATLRTDGGLALTIFGAQYFLDNENNEGSSNNNNSSKRQFRENCVLPLQEAVPFVSQGRSLFCKHVLWCGSNVKVGSDVAVIDNDDKVIAVGVAVLPYKLINQYGRGVAVKCREGLSSRQVAAT